ncbi:MAG: hypothetical protein ACREMT_07165, partial [Vulcanimicrobiaceae bacterium]
AQNKDFGFRIGCVEVPTAKTEDKTFETILFRNDGLQPVDVQAGFSPDATPAKAVYFDVHVDAGSVNVSFLNFSRACGADQTVFYQNLFPQRILTAQAKPPASAVYVACTLTSHAVAVDNGASAQLPLGNGNVGTFAMDQKSQTLYVYDPVGKTFSDANGTYGKDDVSWFSRAYQYHINTKTLAFFRTGSYKEESNLVTPPDYTISDREDGQCQKLTGPPA